MITENLSTLKIHRLTQAQYERELESGNLDEHALYLTPYEIDNEMSDTSTNPVQNMVIYAAINALRDEFANGAW